MPQDSTTLKIAAKQRFLIAFAEKPQVARAARIAGVHRTEVYRWKADPAFVQAMRIAREEFRRRMCEQFDQYLEDRKRWREERERARRPLRCLILAKARAARWR